MQQDEYNERRSDIRPREMNKRSVCGWGGRVEGCSGGGFCIYKVESDASCGDKVN